MNRSIWLSILSILAVVGLVGGLTFAYFSDQGTSTNNVFNSGDLNMKLANNGDSYTDNVTGTWGLASDPGDTFTGDLKIKNTGSVPAHHIELKFTNVVVNGPTESPGFDPTTPLDTVIEITTFGWDSDGNGTLDVDLLPGVTQTNGNGIIDLDDLENQSVDDFDNLLFTDQTADHILRIAGRLEPDLTVNEHQSDSVTMSLAVTMNQDTSQ